MADRLAVILPFLLHTAQQDFTRGRSAVTNIRKVLLVLEQVKQNPSIDAAIISLDAEKTFDNVNINWLFQFLNHMGFTRNIITFLKDLYTIPATRICTPGAIS